MSSEKINIIFFSDTDDKISVISAIKQLQLQNRAVNLSQPRSFTVNPNDIVLIQISGIESKLLGKLIKARGNIKNKVIIITQSGNAVFISSIAKLGFPDIFVFPFELYKFISYVNEIISNKSYRTNYIPLSSFELEIYDLKTLVGKSKSFYKLIEISKKVSEKSEVNILIRGETGTGKGLLSRLIHRSSSRGSSPFVDIVCTAIPENLLESELFGYEPGAFTNARNRKPGLLELAEDGTIMLDEIGDLSLNLQSKLLRTIEKKVIRRLGGVHDIPINARIISVTNKNLEHMMMEKLFRRDLYHRLDVVTIEIPPLRERPEDIIALAEHFISVYNKQFNRNIRKLSNEIKNLLLSYTWPGNVRELKNSMERGVLLSEDENLDIRHFSHITSGFIAPAVLKENIDLPGFLSIQFNILNTTIEDVKKLYAKEVYQRTGRNQTTAADILKITRPTLTKLLE